MIKIIPLPYRDGIEYLKKIYHLDMPILLDSNRCDELDIVSANPRIVLKTMHGKHYRRDHPDKPEEVLETPVHELMQALMPEPIQDTSLPFSGGWMGFFSYDYGRQLEGQINTIADDTHIPEACFGYYDWAVLSRHEKKESLLIYCESVETDPAFLAFKEAVLTSHVPMTPPFQLKTRFASSLSKEQYIKKFDDIAQYIRNGHIYQTNFSKRFEATVAGDPIHAYLELRSHNPAPFGAFIRYDTDGWILSCSPERFIKITSNNVETNPIKGTNPRDADPTLDALNRMRLMNSLKDQAENVMIVDLLRNDLSKHCIPGTVKVPKLFDTLSLKNVHHLVSTVTGKLKSDSTPLDLLIGAFPGGSVTGCPKIRAMQIAESLEPVRRSIFCGTIGYLSSNGHMDTNIVIRTAAIDQTKIYIWAGGGIVYDSTAEDEHQEILHKITNLITFFEQFLAPSKEAPYATYS